MYKSMEDMRNDSLLEGIDIGKRELIKSFLAEGTLSIEKTAEISKFPLETVKEIKAELIQYILCAFRFPNPTWQLPQS